MAEKLSVEIGAEVQGLEKGLKRAEKDIQKFGTNTGKGFAKAGKGAANAVPAVTEFSRVIQDAPFGIQGVANNLQQLTGNFGHLQKAAGGTIPALKLMLKSLAGPAGILLAVSAVTAAMVFFSNRARGAGAAAKKLAKQNKLLGDSLQKYKDSLDAVVKSQLKGAESSIKELTNLRLLKAQVEDSTLSNKKRKEAIDELRKLYPSYLKGMSDEKILTQGLKGTYDELTTAILKKAKAQAAASLITEKEKKILGLTLQLEAKSLENAKRRIGIEAATENILNGGLVKRELGEEALLRLSGEKEAGLKEETKLIKGITKLQEESLKLANQVRNAGGVVPLDFGKGEKGGDDKVGKGKLKGLAFYNKAALESLNKGFDEQLKATTAFNHENELVVVSAAQRQSSLQARLDEIELRRIAIKNKQITELLEHFNNDAKNIINSNISETFGNLAVVIGEALTSGGNVLKSAGSVLLAGLGNILTDMGKMAITIGVGMLGIKTALKTLNPAAAIGAGVALIALGRVFSKGAGNISESIGGGSTGGVGGSGGGGFSGSNTGFNGIAGGIQNIRFELEGTTLIGVINNSMRQDVNMGGSIGLLNT